MSASSEELLRFISHHYIGIKSQDVPRDKTSERGLLSHKRFPTSLFLFHGLDLCHFHFTLLIHEAQFGCAKEVREEKERSVQVKV